MNRKIISRNKDCCGRTFYNPLLRLLCTAVYMHILHTIHMYVDMATSSSVFYVFHYVRFERNGFPEKPLENKMIYTRYFYYSCAWIGIQLAFIISQHIYMCVQVSECVLCLLDPPRSISTLSAASDVLTL